MLINEKLQQDAADRRFLKLVVVAVAASTLGTAGIAGKMTFAANQDAPA